MAQTFKFESLGQPFEADWPVFVPVPQDGGTFKDEEFTVRWKRLPADRVMEIMKAAGGGMSDVVREALVKVYDGGKDVLTPELFSKLQGDPRVELALIKSLGNFASGAALKN